MTLITDIDEFPVLNVKIIPSEMKTIYIEEKQKGFVVLISNKILEQSTDIKELQSFKIDLDTNQLEIKPFNIFLSLKSITRLNIADKKLFFVEEIENDMYRLTFSSAFINNILGAELKLEK